MNTIFSQIAGIISFGSYAMYIVSTLQGKTKPSRSTWWILTLIGAIIFFSSHSVEADGNMWIQLSYVIGPLIIAILSLKHGYGSKKLAAIDKTCIVAAVLCICAWIIFDSPLIAFLGGLVADFIALLPTIKKSLNDAETEDLHSWFVEMTASFTNALGVIIYFDLTDLNWIYAFYLFSINAGITLLLYWNTKVKYKLSV